MKRTLRGDLIDWDDEGKLKLKSQLGKLRGYISKFSRGSGVEYRRGCGGSEEYGGDRGDEEEQRDGLIE